MKTLRSHWFLLLVFIVVALVVVQELITWEKEKTPLVMSVADSTWQAPSLYTDQVLSGEERKMVIYGEDLLSHTAKYLGPQGSVLQISNGMNCQNCHLDAGTRSWGNHYGGVASTYPKFRERSGTTENVEKRVNDCFERSLNGKPLDSGSYEMRSIVAYMKWLGKNIPKGTKPHDTGIEKLPFPDRAADPEKGRLVYTNQCQSCHGPNGEGQPNIDGIGYATPPLWGASSYNDGAGLYRLSNFAGYVKNNMPFNQATKTHPKLTNDEAWDVAAFANSQPRPHIDQSKDWPDISKKPFDFPFAPYADHFEERQHKYGPFQPIVDAKNNKQTANKPNKF